MKLKIETFKSKNSPTLLENKAEETSTTPPTTSGIFKQVCENMKNTLNQMIEI